MKHIIGKVSGEELKSLELIRTKITCSRQALHITPEGTEEKRQFYIQSVLDSFSNYSWLEKDWWNGIFETYKIDKSFNVYIDFTSGELYTNEQ
jgi:hypothetical protein